MKNVPLVVLLLRLSVGASMISHGLVRIPKLAAFSEWMVGAFQKSFLPDVLVQPFSYLLPFAEFLVGFCLIVGVCTRIASVAGSLIMSVLLFGSGLIEEWSAMPSQLLHCLFFVTILGLHSFNRFALDAFLFPSSDGIKN